MNYSPVISPKDFTSPVLIPRDTIYFRMVMDIQNFPDFSYAKLKSWNLQMITNMASRLHVSVHGS